MGSVIRFHWAGRLIQMKNFSRKAAKAQSFSECSPLADSIPGKQHLLTGKEFHCCL